MLRRHFFFGDSICFGQGISPHRGWVCQLAAAIEEKIQPQRMLFANLSRNGDTTRLALERMAYDIQSHEPDTLTIQFGLNDCNFWETDRGLPRVSKFAFEANLIEIIQRAKIFGAYTIYLHTNHPTYCDQVKSFKHSYDAHNRSYNIVIRAVAEKMQVNLIDIEHAFTHHMKIKQVSLDNLLQPDGLHLGTKGHQLYFDTIYTYINS